VTTFPQATVRVQINGEDVLVLGPIGDDGGCHVLCPGLGERGLVLAALADALAIVAGTRPGPECELASKPEPAKSEPAKPRLSLVPKDPEP
jgi:hypothetical protein